MLLQPIGDRESGCLLRADERVPGHLSYVLRGLRRWKRVNIKSGSSQRADAVRLAGWTRGGQRSSTLLQVNRVAITAVVSAVAIVLAVCLLNWPLRDTGAGRWFHGDLPLKEAISQCIDSADREIEGADVPVVSGLDTQFDAERREWTIGGTMVAGDVRGSFLCIVSWSPGAATSYTERLSLPDGAGSHTADID